MTWHHRPNASSVACNPATLKFHRKRLNLTQEQLAQISGYTLRTIVKAETGNPVNLQTIEDLSDSLSDEHFQVSPDDLIVHPVNLAKELVFGWYRYQEQLIPKVSWFLSPDIVFRFSGDPADIPFAGEHRGIREVEKAFEIFFTYLQAPEGDYDYESRYQFVVNQDDPNQVFAWGQTMFHARGKPLQKPMNIQLKMVFCNGLLVLVDDRYDTRIAGDNLREIREKLSLPVTEQNSSD